MALTDYADDDQVDSPNPRIVPAILRTVKDPIHAMIPLTPRLSSFIDTKQFQRLRHIKQLGTSYLVWLGASHNRFEHCIGVAYLARSMATHLQKSQPKLGITDRDVECVEIAGLCHDLGHGPWSHVWDGLFMPTAIPGCKWQHEEGSEMMFDSLVKENNIFLKMKDERFIKALIAGEPGRCDPDEKPFLFDIVANKRNGLDVDKFDYILRDSHMVGDPLSIALPRIIKSARVLDNQICYHIKDANQLYDICAMRFKLHKMVYNHKSAKAIEYMIIDGLLAADPYLGIAKRVYDPKQYLYLTDEIMLRIEDSSDPKLAPARAIFDRIRSRDLYRLVEYWAVAWTDIEAVQKNVTRERIVAAAKALPRPPVSSTGDVTPVNIDALTVDDVVVDFSLMHYGMKEKNPLDFVKFYSKQKPNKSEPAGPGVYSTLMPLYHAEMLMRIYTKKVEYYSLIQAGYHACIERREGVESMVLTPPVTEAPTTPRPRASPSFNSGISVGGGGTPLPNRFMTVSADYRPKSPSRRPAVVRMQTGTEVVGVGEVGASANTVAGSNAKARAVEVVGVQPRVDGGGMKVRAGMKRQRGESGDAGDPGGRGGGVGDGNGDGEPEMDESGDGGRKRRTRGRKRSCREGGG